MKNVTKHSIIILLSVGLLLMVTGGYSQENKKGIRKAKREARAAEQEKQFQSTTKLVDKLNFVLKADRIENKPGLVYHVDPKINFIIVDTVKTTVQISSGLSTGDNGVGGKTAEGKVLKLKYKKNEKHKSFFISFYLSSYTERYKIDINISGNGNATAYLSTIKGGSSIKLIGTIVPMEQSVIYKGAAHY